MPRKNNRANNAPRSAPDPGRNSSLEYQLHKVWAIRHGLPVEEEKPKRERRRRPVEDIKLPE